MMLGIAVAYALVIVRMGIGPVERTHLFEYGLVAVLIHQALEERIRNGGRVRAPVALAIGVTALLGWVDEGIQYLLPNRHYDWLDVGLNLLAAVLAVAALAAVAEARRADTTSGG